MAILAETRGGLPSPQLLAGTGISSYAFRYAIGFAGFSPARPMTAFDFLREAHRLGLRHAQLCENLDYAARARSDLERIRGTAADLGLALEVGMKSLNERTLEQHLEIASILQSRFLRVVLGDGGDLPESSPDALVARSIAVFRGLLPRIRDTGMTVGIENHFDVETERLVEIVDALGGRSIGLVFDTTNCLGFLRRPEEALRLIGPRVVSVHLKDYSVRKVEAGYLISGEVLGEGCLDVEATVEAVRCYNPRATIMLEMTIRRRDGLGAEDTVDWERAAVDRSAAALRAAVLQASGDPRQPHRHGAPAALLPGGGQ